MSRASSRPKVGHEDDLMHFKRPAPTRLHVIGHQPRREPTASWHWNT
jgi:hypothetical protein